MIARNPSPAERFRDELGYRLSVDAHLCLPSANVLVGVMIDAMEAIVSLNGIGDTTSCSKYLKESRLVTLSSSTLRNVMSVSEEILSLGRILGVSILSSYSSREASAIILVPSAVLQDLQFLSLPRMALDGPSCPPSLRTRSHILRTYLSVARALSSYIGPQGVKDLINDFNRPSPQPVAKTEGYTTRRVPGVGPRVVRHESQRRRVNPMMFRPVERISDSQERRSPPPAYQTCYARNSRGWPISSRREKSSFAATLGRTFSSKTNSRWSADSPELKQEEAEVRGWRSLRLKLRSRV
ncbi:hypothetical protein FRC09_015729 [Ceratobasidium sp. 395]|nr:hypothetical protein FRC09_015729 [Ceratobasidium sp. 395]